MHRVPAVLPALGLAEDRAGWVADHFSSCQWQTPGEEEGGLSHCHPPRANLEHSQTGLRRGQESGLQITTPVVLASDGA